MPLDYVYTGVWLKYDNPAKGATLTVTNLAALFILGGIMILVAVTQSRTWIIIRYIFTKCRSLHLKDDLDDISQWVAMKIWWEQVKKAPAFRRISRSDPTQQNRQLLDYHVSPWIGLGAILNTLLFAIGGVVIPWLLADGWLGAPEVRSQQTDHCVDAWAKDIPENNTSVLSSILLSEAIWEACYGEKRSNSYCDPNFAGIEGYSLKIGTDCPFPAPICLRDQPTLTFTRANMTPHELSINSRLSMTVSHQITCGTISMDPFIYQVPQPPNMQLVRGNFTFSIQNPSLVKDPSQLNPELGLNMRTDNSLGSGLEMLEKGNGLLLSILPVPHFKVTPETSDLLHPLLRQPDGRTFVFVFRAGATLQLSTRPISDPFFSASTLWEGPPFYVPDREATAIGCIERFQVCFDSKSAGGYRCYPWMSALMDFPKGMMPELLLSFGLELSMDYIKVFDRNLEINASSLLDFLQRRTNLRRPLLAPQLRLNPTNPGVIRNIDSARQWILELDALFSKAVVWQKMRTLSFINNDNDYSNNTLLPPGKPFVASLCDRILLINGDYTNINWIGIWIPIVFLLLLCLISYADAFIEWGFKYIWVLLYSILYANIFIHLIIKWVRKYILPSKEILAQLSNSSGEMMAWVRRKYRVCFVQPRRGGDAEQEIELGNNSQPLEEFEDNPI
ncbi:hypothetical protein L207DRAFT_538952 [Hyaloscypha variabilis F]|uniref:Uncharacterized protein n=1 Tax=Hyaloscypha variabilis (strain UAMH 11265 / GT02V1 / F) TaxID=1149755 RepID=A0A2J6QSV9_HYAVF|nr:hypothetical protein L207DRAFT_538952 [Hyaloscypha variabilis F]